MLAVACGNNGLLLLLGRMLQITIVAFCLLLLRLCSAACPSPLPNAVVPSGYCAQLWTTNVNRPRGIITDSNGDVLVLESGLGQISLFYDTSSGLQKLALATASGLNHAVLINGEYLYASSATTVYRWPYKAGARTPLGSPQTVITGIPTGGHTSRSLIFDTDGNLLVQVGSGTNVDPNANRAGIRKFSLSTIPQDFSTGAWFAWGLRNEVGLRADEKGNLWGVENGMDELYRADLGGDIHLGNPGEELNFFGSTGDGAFYGYPYCFSQYNLTTVTTPVGTQYAVPQFMGDGVHIDKWCQNTTNVVKPAYQIHPHTAPLDLLFYYGTTFPGVSGNLFISEHGSWNSDPPVGYRVVQVHFENGQPVSDSPFLSYVGPGQNGAGWHRPVALTIAKSFAGDEMLLVTSDATNVVISVQYSPTAENKITIA